MTESGSSASGSSTSTSTSALTPPPARSLACIEVGGSGRQTITFSGADAPADGPSAGPGAFRIEAGDHIPPGADLALAVPGIFEGHRVVAASNLGWYDVDPVEELGLDRRPIVVCNDAEAAALGEWALRPSRPAGLLYVGLGTGVGGAVVRDGRLAAANLLGHQRPFGDRRCVCGRVGCLESVVGGWALPAVVDDHTLAVVATALADAITSEPQAAGCVVVLAGGVVDGYGALLPLVSTALPGWSVEASARPAGAKSAAAWGLRLLVGQQATELSAGGRGPRSTADR